MLAGLAAAYVTDVEVKVVNNKPTPTHTYFIADSVGTITDDVTILDTLTLGDTFTTLMIEGTSADAVETFLTFTNPTSSDKTINFPNASGTVCVTASTPLTLSALGNLTIGDAAADGSTKGAAAFLAADFDAASGIISIDYANGQSAVANSSTRGFATFTTNDFNSSSGNISLDYTNGQAASASVNGFLSSANWTTFNNKWTPSGAQYRIPFYATTDVISNASTLTFDGSTGTFGTANINYTGQETQNSKKVVMVKQAAGSDNTAFAAFTVTSPNAGGTTDNGTYTIHVKCLITNNQVSGSSNVSAGGYSFGFSRAIRNNGTGTNSAVTAAQTSAIVNNIPGNLTIATVTGTVTETTEYVQTFNLQVDLDPNTIPHDVIAILEVTLEWYGFASAPILA